MNNTNKSFQKGDEVRSTVNSAWTYIIIRAYKHSCWVEVDTGDKKIIHKHIPYNILRKIEKEN